MSAHVNKNLFYVGLCKKMKIMTFPENMIYKIKNTHFVRDTKKKGKSFLFGLSTLCQSNNLSQQKKDIFFVGMEIDDYFLFGYEPSTSSFLFRFLGFFFFRHYLSFLLAPLKKILFFVGNPKKNTFFCRPS